jgi:hypothetical protein
MSNETPEDIPETVAEFQARLREGKPLWNRNFLRLFLPGFLLFGFGGPLGLLMPGGRANNNRWMIFSGLALCLAGGARGAWLMWTYRRCPACGRFQRPEWRIPYRTCIGCGARLSMGVKDST